MEIDWTVVAFEGLNFAILVVVLQRFLFRPVKNALETRRREIEAQRSDMEAREAAATELRASYEAKLDQLEEELRAKADAVMDTAHEKAGKIIEDGRAQAKQLVDSAGRECETARKRALEQMRLEVFNLAVDAATRVVRHMGAPSVALAYARRAAHDCQEILEGLESPPVEPVVLLTGPDADIDEVKAEVGSILGASVSLAASVDPEIVAGVRIAFAGHEVEASASATLQHWYAARIEGARDGLALEQTG
jgi:F-type H+-transporting ATPase subunit b